MKPRIAITIFFYLIFIVFSVFPQNSENVEKKYSPTELKEDLRFLKRQIFEVHANPWSELSKAEYEKLFDSIEAKIKDSMTRTKYF